MSINNKYRFCLRTTLDLLNYNARTFRSPLSFYSNVKSRNFHKKKSFHLHRNLFTCSLRTGQRPLFVVPILWQYFDFSQISLVAWFCIFVSTAARIFLFKYQLQRSTRCPIHLAVFYRFSSSSMWFSWMLPQQMKVPHRERSGSTYLIDVS